MYKDRGVTDRDVYRQLKLVLRKLLKRYRGWRVAREED